MASPRWLLQCREVLIVIPTDATEEENNELERFQAERVDRSVRYGAGNGVLRTEARALHRTGRGGREPDLCDGWRRRFARVPVSGPRGPINGDPSHLVRGRRRASRRRA